MSLMTLLCYLLYVCAITSPNSYEQAYIDQKEQENYAEIQAIDQDPVLSVQVQNEFWEAATYIEVFDPTSND